MLAYNRISFQSQNIPAPLRDKNDSRLADVVILCASAKSALAQTLDSVERGGTVLIFAGMEKDAKIE